ncbi:MAG: NADH-quinone oxidoreductase subunit NuoH [Gemmataceae bacterium]|nr:NADH-quinone oxidoreductase subunit NuoH [Gemmataceae bacterium]
MPVFDPTTTAILIVVLLAGALGLAGYLVLSERKIAAWIQDRKGPNRVGPGGLFQPIADGVKMFLKEEVIPAHVDKVFYLLAPIVSVSTALLALAVIPIGPTTPPPPPLPIPSGATPAQLVDQFQRQQAEYQQQTSFVLAPGLDVGILYVFALGSLAVYGVILAGWSSNSKYSLLGCLRASAQIVSYEIPLGLAVLGVILMTGSLNLETIIARQTEHGPYWFILFQPLALLLFMISLYAEDNRLPFDLAEAEQELVGGYHTEYSSMKLGLMLLAEYVHLVISSFLVTVVFLGGWSLFGLEALLGDTALTAGLKVCILCGKMLFLVLFAQVIRWTIPRFRFDQLMNLAWKVLIPLGLLNLACVMVVLQWGLPWVTLTGTSLLLLVGAGYLSTRWQGSVSVPRRKVVPLPPGLPPGVTFAPQH